MVTVIGGIVGARAAKRKARERKVENLLRAGKEEEAKAKCKASRCDCLFGLGTEPKKQCCCFGESVSDFDIIKKRVKRDELDAALMIIGLGTDIANINEKKNIDLARLLKWKNMSNGYTGDKNDKEAILAFFKEKERNQASEGNIRDTTPNNTSQKVNTVVELTNQIENQNNTASPNDQEK